MKQIFSYLIPYRARMAVGFSIKVAATIVELLIPWALSISSDSKSLIKSIVKEMQLDDKTYKPGVSNQGRHSEK